MWLHIQQIFFFCSFSFSFYVLKFSILFHSGDCPSNLQEGYLVYECNDMCRCNKSCPNRILQNGVRVKLEVFKTEKKVTILLINLTGMLLKACYVDFCDMIGRDGQ